MEFIAPVLFLAGVSAAPEYPVVDILDTMRGACVLALANEGVAEKLNGAGWTPAVVEPGGWVDQALQQEQQFLGKSSPPSKVFAKDLSGRRLIAFVNAIQTEDSTLRLCTVQDPLAKIESAPEQFVKWAGRPSTSPTFGLDPALEAGLNQITFMKNWKPGLDGVSDDTTIRYVPLEYGPLTRGQNAGLTYSTELEVKAK